MTYHLENVDPREWDVDLWWDVLEDQRQEAFENRTFLHDDREDDDDDPET